MTRRITLGVNPKWLGGWAGVFTSPGVPRLSPTAKWAADLEKKGVKVPERWSTAGGTKSARGPVQQVGDLADNDLNAAVRFAEKIKAPADRMAAKALLASRVISSGVSAKLGERLRGEAAALSDRLPVTPGTAAALLSLASDLAAKHPARSLGVLRRVHDHVTASSDAEYRARWLEEIGDRGYRSAREEDAGHKALTAFRQEAAREARAAALNLPADHRLHRQAVQASFQEELHGDRMPGEQTPSDPARFQRALGWARQMPVEKGRRVGALLQVADKAMEEDAALARDVLSEARDLLPAPETSWNAIHARAACVATAAIGRDERCWKWATADAELVRRSPMPAVEGAPGVPMEFRRAHAEAVILGATFGTGDIQRAKRFMESQSQLGGYDAARAFWCDLVYIWDPSHSRDLAEKLLADLKTSRSPLRACIAGAAAAPSFAYEALVPNLEVAQRADALFDAALALAETSDLSADRALAAAGLAAVSASVDAARCARAVALARTALLTIPDDAARDDLAQPVCAMIAVADPQASAEIAANVKDPARRIEARLSAASGMMFSLSEMRDGWRRSLGAMPLGMMVGPYDAGDEEPEPAENAAEGDGC